MVGLIQKNSEMPLLQSQSSHGALLALAAVARETLEDDTKGSLRRKVEERYSTSRSRGFWGRPKKRFAVFAIRGLTRAADLPGSRGFGANEALLSKIEKYAHEENRIIVVPYPSYISSDGTDFTEYYARFGFEKLEMADGKKHVLVYTGTSLLHEESWAVRSRYMVSLAS